MTRHPRKPDVPTAMRRLIAEIRAALPFGRPEARRCDGLCQGCHSKLLEYLDMRLLDWEARLDSGERLGLADLSQLIKTTNKIRTVLRRKGLA